MAKFYGQRTFTLDIIVYISDYHKITHTTIAEMLHEENLLHNIDATQISTCHRYASICFKTRELLLEFCKQEHIILPDIPVQFAPDYYDISIENLPIELPNEDVYDFLSAYATPIGKTYTGKRHNNKYYTTGTRVYQCIHLYYTTGTRVYQCIHLQQHLPRHVYEFGRYLRIRYNSQPTPASTTTSENNENTPLPDNQQTTSQTQENITQPKLPQNTPTAQKKNQSNKQRQYHNRTTHQTKHKDNNKPIQQTQRKPQKDNIQTPPAEQQSSDSESDTDSMTIPQPTLTPTEKRTLSPEEQQSFLYWRGQIDVGGGQLKIRYTLYPNQLYRYLKEKKIYKSKAAAESELEMYFEKTEIETDYGPKTYL